MSDSEENGADLEVVEDVDDDVPVFGNIDEAEIERELEEKLKNLNARSPYSQRRFAQLEIGHFFF